MASAFSHALAAVTLGKLYSGKKQAAKFWVLGMICAVFPDLDVISFKFGIPYSHMFGHRGITHSVFFAIVFGGLIAWLFFREDIYKGKNRLKLWAYFFVCTVSHGMLDALTTGGRGVAFWAPFSGERIFFPWKVIRVSPISVSDFFGEWGIRVLKSEFYWIGIPCFAILFVLWIFRKLFKGRTPLIESVSPLDEMDR